MGAVDPLLPPSTHMNINRFNQILKRLDRRLFAHKDHGVWRIRRMETRWLKIPFQNELHRFGFRNRNLASAQKIMRLPRLSKSALYHLYAIDSKRHDVVNELNISEMNRQDELRRRIRAQANLGAIYLVNRRKIISV